VSRKNRRRRRSLLGLNNEAGPASEFLQSCVFFKYQALKHEQIILKQVQDIKLGIDDGNVYWLNSIGKQFFQFHKELILNNKLDDFLNILLDITSQRNKSVELDNCIYLTTQSIYSVIKCKITLETISFVFSSNYIWSIQDDAIDPFDNIRIRIAENQGIIRQKGVDYLLFSMFEAIIDNYFIAFKELSQELATFIEGELIGRQNQQLINLEELRKTFYELKKAAIGLRESISQFSAFDNPMLEKFNAKYFYELKEQIISLTDEIDSELHRIESATNLYFSMQNRRLNEVMKTLTVITVLFIPLNFITGLFGMNFEFIPGLKSPNGFYFSLALMIFLIISILYYFKRKKWF